MFLYGLSQFFKNICLILIYLKLYVQVSALCHFLNETFFFTRFHNYFEFMLSSRKGIKIEFKVR